LLIKQIGLLNDKIDNLAGENKLWDALNSKNRGNNLNKQKKYITELEVEINSLKREHEFFDKLSSLLSEKEEIVRFNQRFDSVRLLSIKIHTIATDEDGSIILNMEKELEDPPKEGYINKIFNGANTMQLEMERQLQLADSLLRTCEHQKKISAFELESSGIKKTLTSFQSLLEVQKTILNERLHRVLIVTGQCEVRILESKIIQSHNSNEQSALDNLLKEAKELNVKLQGEYYSDEIKNRAADLLTIPHFLDAEQKLQELEGKYQRIKAGLDRNVNGLNKEVCTIEQNVELFNQIGVNLQNNLKSLEEFEQETVKVIENLYKNKSKHWELKLNEPLACAMSLLNKSNNLSQANLKLLNKYRQFKKDRSDLEKRYDDKISIYIKGRRSILSAINDFFTPRSGYIKKLKNEISNYVNTANSQPLLKVIAEGSKRFDNGMASILRNLLSEVERQHPDIIAWTSEAAQEAGSQQLPQFRS
jgi:hypothetical protein